MRRNLALCTSAVALALAAPAFAQTTSTASTPNTAAPANGDAGSTTVKEVIVTGFRASLQSALNAKRANILPIESVAPEDIGKMPDQNVAESLQRLPGVQIDHSYGQGTQVLIDGLRQNLTTLNGDTFLTGKEFYVSGEASGGGAGGNSQYNSLEGIPSEEVGRIDVYKSPNASITEGGMGGTIDLRTRDPLDAPAGFTFGGNVRGTASDNTSGTTPNATLVGSYKLNSTLAFTGSVSYDDEKTFTKEYEAYNRNTWTIDNWATPTYTGVTSAANMTTLPNGQYYINPSYGYFSNINDERKVLGGAFGASWRPTAALRFDFNWFYSKEDDTTITYSNKLDFNQNQNPSNTPSPGINTDDPYSIDKNMVVQDATYYATGAETATLYQHFLSEANNFQLRARYDDGGPFRGSLDFSLSRADSNLQADQADVEHGLYETASGAATNPGAPGCNNGAATCAGDPAATQSGYQFRYTNGGTSGLPTATYTGPLSNVLSNPAWTLFKSNWAWANYGVQDQYALRADGDYKFSNLNLPALGETNLKISFGVRAGYRDAQEIFGRYLIDGDYNNYGITGGGAPNGNYLYYLDPGYTTPNIPYSTATSNPKLGMLVNSWGGGSFLTKNPYTGGMTNPSTYLETVWQGAAGTANPTEKFFEDTLSSFQVAERTYAGYVMADLSPPDKRYNINFGVRVVSTDLTIDGAQTAASPTYYGTASWNGVNSNNEPTTTHRTYTDVLPTFNAVFNLTDTQLIRLSAARVMSPQDLYSLGLGNTYNFTRNATRTNKNGGTGGFFFDGGSSGNPNLDPYRANQGLISYENYFKKGDMISVEVFVKEIESFVESKNVLTTVADDFGTDTADVSKPVNAGGGQVAGFELNGIYNLGDEWTPWLKGFGVTANYTYSDSTSDQTTSFTNHLGIPGVSKNSVTATGFFERAGFSARLSWTWRSAAVNDGLGGATFQFPDQTGTPKTWAVFQAPYGQLDGQVSYDFNPHVGLVFSVQNISDSALHTYMQYPNQPFTYDDWGRRYFFGIKFKG